MWVVRCKGVVIYMRFFDYIDTIEKPTIENIRVIYKAINEKYDDLIDMALEPNSKNYKKWVHINDNLNMYINDHLRMYTSDYALI